MVSPPPWHFSGDVLWIDYDADPAACARFLPDGLVLDGGGRLGIGFCDWQWCSESGEELVDPVRAQFRECLLVVPCLLDGEPVGRVPFAWVDSAVPLVRGHVQGMPKLFGSVWLTRSYGIGRASAERAAGGMFGAALSWEGRRTVSARVTLQARCDAPSELALRPLVHTRLFPAWQPGEAPLSELVRSRTTGVAFADAWCGVAEVLFEDVTDENLRSLAPVGVCTGYLFSYSETLWPGSRVTASS